MLIFCVVVARSFPFLLFLRHYALLIPPTVTFKLAKKIGRATTDSFLNLGSTHPRVGN